jgi:lysophospholipase L1-like esterase
MELFNKPFLLTVFKRILDLGIGIYAIMIPIIIATGGFKVEILGISIRASHVYTPLRFLIPLVLIRLILTVEFRNFLLLLVSLFVGLAGAELALRILDPPIARPKLVQIHRASSILDWELIPGAYGVGGFGESYHINAAGFRDRELKLKKQPNASRIMVIGDSFTFGPGVDLKDTYPKQIMRILNHDNIRCEVINCGVVGYDMWQYYAMLKQKILPYQPDLVVVGLFLNDINDSIAPYEYRDHWKAANPFEPEGLSRLTDRFFLWNFLKNVNYLFETKYRHRRGYRYLQGIEKRKSKFGPEDPTNTWYKIMYGTLEKHKYEAFRVTLKKFVQTSRSAGVRVLVAMIPDSVQLNEPAMQHVNRFVQQTCREIGVPFIDSTPRLEKEKDPRLLYLFPKDAHNSPLGYALIAQSIADRITELGLLPH